MQTLTHRSDALQAVLLESPASHPQKFAFGMLGRLGALAIAIESRRLIVPGCLGLTAGSGIVAAVAMDVGQPATAQGMVGLLEVLGKGRQDIRSEERRVGKECR